MLNYFFHSRLTLGLAQSVLTALVALLVMLLARRRAPGILHDLPVAMLRGVIQIVAVGAVLAIMVFFGVIPLTVTMLVPVGSMVIANTMNTQSLFLDRLRGEVTSHVGEIESALALGAAPDAALLPYLRTAFRACLIPSVDNVRSLGIVWIPGIMAGMVLSGEPPIYAAFYQFVVLTTIFSASALTCFVSSHLVTQRLFSPQEQLLLRA